MKPLVIGSIILTLILASFMFTRSSFSRGGYESASYRLILKDGPNEVRGYEKMSLVTASMPSVESETPGKKTERKAGDDGFMKLFRYISGNNEAEQKIAMTTPVFIDTKESSRSMSFVLPNEVAEKGAPRPSADSLTLGEVESGTFAVRRFKGSRKTTNGEKALAELQDWIATRSLITIGTPMFAYYDPPWTPGPLRRNEVLLRIHWAAD